MNECDLGTHNCSSKADCLNLEGSFKCKCIFGFTGDGSTTTFTLSVTPTNVNYTLVSVQGVAQPRTAYSLSGSSLTFSSAPYNTAVIEVTTLGGSVTSSGITVVSSPAHNNSTGTVGQIAYDSSYLYVCVNTNTWVRSAITTSW
jgi:hypothetical protein